MKRKPPIEKEQLNQLYINALSIHKVGLTLSVSGDTVSRWLKYYDIPIKNDPKRFDLLRQVGLTQIQHEFVVGSLLGDGNLDSKKINSRLRFCHGLSQVEYLNWKKNLLGNLVQQSVIKHHQKTRNSIIHSFQTIQHQDFAKYYEMFYKCKKKIIPVNIESLITPFALAVWFMDDGWRSKKYRSALICTDSFSKEENELLVDGIRNKFDIDVNLRNSSNRITIYGNEVDKLSKIIQPYIIPSMLYKIGL